MTNTRITHFSIQKIREAGLLQVEDKVAIEEPLEIQLLYSTPTGRMKKSVAVTMRTPGHDSELAAGFLFTEGILTDINTIADIKSNSADENQVLISLKENEKPALAAVVRNFYSTSSCGICGKASIEAIKTTTQFAVDEDAIIIPAAVFYRLHDTLKTKQDVFKDTGGIHASALFTFDGKFILLREDVGRHNALDKIIGTAFMKRELPLKNCILLLSGRASFELVQKAAMAGIRVVAAVGAPSSLAVEMARDAGITLIGFLKKDGFNIYSGKQRIKTI